MIFPSSKKLLVGSAIILTLIAIGYFATHGSAKVVYVTDTAKLGEIDKTVDVTGSLSPLSHVNIGFQSSGVVARVYTHVGDLVKKGELLASLSAADLSADARRAEADLNLALAEAKPEDIAAAKADISSAEVSVTNAETALTITRSVNEINITTADDAVDKAKEDQAKSLTNDAQASKSALESSIISVRTGLSKADQLLGLENTLFNVNFKNELGAEDTQALQNAKDSFALAAVDRTLAEKAVAALTFAPDDASLAQASTLTLRALEETADTLLYTRQTLDATSADSRDLSLDDLVAYKTMIDAARTEIESSRTALVDAETARAQDALTFEHTVRTAELNADSVRATATKTEADATANLLSAQAALEKVTAAYNKLIAPPRSVDIAPYLASRDGATARYLKSEITAPITGKIGKVDLTLGEAATAGVGVISLEPTTRSYEIVVNVPESDVAHLTLGDTATITFDAFGSDTIFTGTLSSLDQSEQIIENVVFYEARIAVVDGSRMNDLRNGMSADVTILIETKTNVLTVPTRAILEKNGKKIVRVLVNDEMTEKEIVAGLRGDDGVSEIISGLNVGDIVVVSIQK